MKHTKRFLLYTAIAILAAWLMACSAEAQTSSSITVQKQAPLGTAAKKDNPQETLKKINEALSALTDTESEPASVPVQRQQVQKREQVQKPLLPRRTYSGPRRKWRSKTGGEISAAWELTLSGGEWKLFFTLPDGRQRECPLEKLCGEDIKFLFDYISAIRNVNRLTEEKWGFEIFNTERDPVRPMPQHRAEEDTVQPSGGRDSDSGQDGSADIPPEPGVRTSETSRDTDRESNDVENVPPENEANGMEGTADSAAEPEGEISDSAEETGPGSVPGNSAEEDESAETDEQAGEESYTDFVPEPEEGISDSTGETEPEAVPDNFAEEDESADADEQAGEESYTDFVPEPEEGISDSAGETEPEVIPENAAEEEEPAETDETAEAETETESVGGSDAEGAAVPAIEGLADAVLQGESDELAGEESFADFVSEPDEGISDSAGETEPEAVPDNFAEEDDSAETEGDIETDTDTDASPVQEDRSADSNVPVVADGASLGAGREAGEKKAFVIDGVKLTFCWCPPGEFTMGSPESEEGRFQEETEHSISLTEGFWLLETEVTQEMWERVMGADSLERKAKDFFGTGPDFPVSRVNWEECREFCKKLGELAGCTASLPTEAQWEYACRAGSTDAYAGSGQLGEMGWYEENSEGKAHPVKGKHPNAWGLYDMYGNVWEWCLDWYDDDYYENSEKTDPAGPPGEEDEYKSIGGSAFFDVAQHVIRGGGWLTNSEGCRSASRRSAGTLFRNGSIGFRFLLNPVSGSEPVGDDSSL